MGKLEVERMDPHQRQMLEVARECMEDAGEINGKERPVGCYIGSFGEDWIEMCTKETQQYGQHRVSGCGDFMLPNRVSYEMNLTGPRGYCEGAIVGGANLTMAPGMTTTMTEQGVILPDASCKSFSADSNGYARAEAISAIFIKPLADAIRDENPVRAIIRATACNGRGTGMGTHVPNDISHEAMIRRAYEVAGIADYSQSAFVECHGTGTQVGDPIETRAVGRVFGPSGGVLIGSVKPNLGHSEGASGITSLIKSILALENRIIPPNIKLKERSPSIQWDEYGFSVPTEAMPWPEARSERISVNSFGIGGSNAHVILDSARSFGIFPVAPRCTVLRKLLVYSANTVESLKQMIFNYTAYVQKNPARVADLAPSGQLTTSSPSTIGETPNIVMVFTGQGAQWPQMGGSMIHNSAYPASKKSIQDLDSHLQALTHALEWSIEEELLKGLDTSRLGSSKLSLPLCTAIQVALIDTFASVGVHPAAVVGHSSGEVAAAYASGAITPNEAITIAFYRGQASKAQTRPGSMAAIGMSTEGIQEYLQAGVVVACENSPKSVTLAGDANAIANAVARINNAHLDVLARQLKADKAYHSHHMTDARNKFYALIEHEVSAKAPNTFFFSSVESKLLTETENFGSKYWQIGMQSPIAKNMVLFQIGPRSALAGPLRQIQSHLSTSSPYISAFVCNQDSTESFLTAIGQLHLLNAVPKLEKIISKESTLPDLPRKLFHLNNAPWIRDQKVGDNIVFPFVGYVAMIGEALRQLTGAKWNTAVDPKIRGTLNLHNSLASASAELDFFVLFSSVSGVLGLPGQSNYAGANTFLDSFSQYQLGLGLPCCVIDISIVEGVGYSIEQEGALQKPKASAGLGGTISEVELLSAVEAAMTPVPSSASGGILETFITQGMGDAALFNQPDSSQMFAVEIGRKVFSFLLKPEEDLVTSCSLSDLEMDSLVASEVKQWWKTTFGFDISVLELMGMDTFDILESSLGGRVGERHEAI
ncbi:Acyl transferase/acyl hydrolase/lysophospholipase [Penicillium cf. griseofulvum]|nr:Acyl transferase/acyl hydrolase/lysophospholipase [Penicillium cf. griseofulvum]